MIGTLNTWRIIPFSKWLITMVNKSLTWGCGTPSKWLKWIVYGGYDRYLTEAILQVAWPVWQQQKRG